MKRHVGVYHVIAKPCHIANNSPFRHGAANNHVDKVFIVCDSESPSIDKRAH